jgi:hypothetical protein
MVKEGNRKNILLNIGKTQAANHEKEESLALPIDYGKGREVVVPIPRIQTVFNTSGKGTDTLI